MNPPIIGGAFGVTRDDWYTCTHKQGASTRQILINGYKLFYKMTQQPPPPPPVAILVASVNSYNNNN